MVKLLKITSKLQRALLAKGIMVKVNQQQFFSERRNAMITRYTVLRTEKAEDNTTRNVTLLETFNVIDVVNLLKEMMHGGG